ncbi:uncharacterized protein DUF3793 [Kineothrix alysoides]|uniref:Uncharacterized protein DUF3793 n=1 Tax=Kineothrix alysoides TaxID=1469948 RepID=A0A4R1QX03_9FIRM|nr:DUF3793 family protein [Kineothrix alysoides]TCL57555.1 uncharacterized protein DUF3793 [Kineothrix alysoides]
MSKDVFEIMQKIDIKNIETQLALQCAPLIAGLKVSNLLIIRRDKLAQLIAILRSTSISCYALRDSGEKITLLLFNKTKLVSYLKQERVIKLLAGMGYRENSLYDILPIFRERYRKYMSDKIQFPHEMGVLLGYPIEDVEGFIRHNGRNSMLTGYWKVYENIAAKEQLFHRFEIVKETMLQLVFFGVGMEDIIESYREDRLQEIAA